MTDHAEKTPPRLCRYLITVSVFEAHEVEATSAGAARYRDYVAYCDAFSRIPFRDFLRRVSVLHLGMASR